MEVTFAVQTVDVLNKKKMFEEAEPHCGIAGSCSLCKSQ